MTIGLLFWILYIVGFVFYGYRSYSAPYFLDSLFWWVLILLLGIAEFGWPIKG